ncbi:MAG: ABC transporter substrate-binding protein [Rhizobiales bacterium]|nr:ABC transporter substrate-binding protein [Hyphomicrobiales bacterium]
MEKPTSAGPGHAAPPDFTRRTLLKGGASLGGAFAVSALAPSFARAAAIPELEIWGPPAGPSITVLHAIATGALDAAIRKPSLRVWRQVDEVRAGLTSGSLDVGIMPVPVAANLYNRGLGVRLVNVMTNGILYVMSTDASLTSLEALRGRKLATLFPNELPTLLLERLFRHAGIDSAKEIELVPTATPLEAVQLLVLGRVDAAIIPEPAASAAVVKGSVAGKTVHRVIDLQAEWGRMTGAHKIVPQAGLVVTDRFRTANASVLEAIQAGLVKAAADVVAHPARAANNAAGPLQMPWPVIEQSIPYSNLVATPARDVRPAIEAVLQAMADVNPRYSGGRLPEQEFYL